MCSLNIDLPAHTYTPSLLMKIYAGTTKFNIICLTVCIHARTLPTVILKCHSQ